MTPRLNPTISFNSGINSITKNIDGIKKTKLASMLKRIARAKATKKTKRNIPNIKGLPIIVPMVAPSQPSKANRSDIFTRLLQIQLWPTP